MGLIYCAINKKNFKMYVGLTTGSLERRIISHKHKAKHGASSYFHAALNKYGVDNFYWVILTEKENVKDLRAKESFFIEYLSTTDRLVGYNLTTGGEHPVVAEETREKLRKLMTGRYDGENNPFFGKKHSKELKEKFSHDRKGIKNSSFEKHSTETKKLLSEKRIAWSKVPENKEKLVLQNQHRKITMCLEDGMEFTSIKEASKFYEINYSTFKKYLKLGLPIKGKTFKTKLARK